MTYCVACIVNTLTVTCAFGISFVATVNVYSACIGVCTCVYGRMCIQESAMKYPQGPLIPVVVFLSCNWRSEISLLGHMDLHGFCYRKSEG